MSELVPVADMERMAIAIARSGLFGMKSPDQALALMLVAQAEGRHPGSVARDYHIIQGRAALRADTMLARFQAAGGSVEWHEVSDEKADATFRHPAGGSLRLDWTMARATAAGLTGKAGPWKQYPRAMLRARVISEAVRTIYPGVLDGLYTPEEIQDFAPSKEAAHDLGPANVVEDGGPEGDTPSSSDGGSAPGDSGPARPRPVLHQSVAGAAPRNFRRAEALHYARKILDTECPAPAGEKISVGALRVLKDVLGRGEYKALSALSDGELYQLLRVQKFGDGVEWSKLTRTVDLVKRGIRRPEAVEYTLWPPMEDGDIPEGAPVADAPSDAEVF